MTRKGTNKEVHWSMVALRVSDEELLLLDSVVQRLNSDRTKTIKLAIQALATAIVEPKTTGVPHADE
jgi:hypothetical protein